VPIQSHGPAVTRPGTTHPTAALEDAPFPLSILAIDGSELRDFVREAGRGFFAGRYSIGAWLPALDRLPEAWAGSLSLLEEVWVPSRHAASAIDASASVPVTILPPAVTAPPSAPHSREQLGLPTDRLLFLSVVDHAAGPGSSDPLQVMEAFRIAAPAGEEAALVLRCINADHDPDAHARVIAAAAEIGATVLDRSLSAGEERSVIAVCDCMVSLHRGVAFGLPLAQAMWHGKPVIATGYSGNLDFMTKDNSLLVDHEVVAAGAAAAPYPPDARWAIPDLNDAAARMREVLSDTPEIARLASRAARDIRDSHSPDAVGRTMAHRLELIRATGRARVPLDDLTDVPPAIATMPLRVLQAAKRQAAPGRAQRAREIARRGVVRVMRPVTMGQHTINDGFIAALMELNSAIVELRRDDAGKRAGLLAQLRQYERLMSIGESDLSGIGEIKRILTLQTDRSVYLALAELARRHEAIAEGPVPERGAAPLTAAELRVFSQNGEDGVLAEILRRIGAPGRYFIEFGVETGREGNCVYLADVAGWRGLFLEPDERCYAELASKYRAQSAVTTLNEAVTPANAEQLFDQVGAPRELDVLSIDVDGQDYWIWEAISSYRPRVLVIEYNSALDPRRALVQPNEPDRTWDGTDYFGASLGALRRLGETKGYRLVHTDLSGVNAFFVRDDLTGAAFPGFDEVAQRGTPNYFQSGVRHPRAQWGGRYLDLETGRLVQV
jgi:glycosyltransferase involved in cell wall biosynthesis